MKQKRLKRLALCVLLLVCGLMLSGLPDIISVSPLMGGVLQFSGYALMLACFITGAVAWRELGQELRRSPVISHYVIFLVFFAPFQILWGILNIIFCLATIFPFGIFTLHQRLPGAFEIVFSVFQWEGRAQWLKVQKEKSSNDVVCNEQYHVQVDRQNFETAFAPPVNSQKLGTEVNDYVRYLEGGKVK